MLMEQDQQLVVTEEGRTGIQQQKWLKPQVTTTVAALATGAAAKVQEQQRQE